MTRSAAVRTAIAAIIASIGVPARALLLVSALSGALSCTDSDSGHHPPDADAGASSAGEAGEQAAGQSGSSEPAAGEGGTGDIGGIGGIGGMGGIGGTAGTPGAGGAPGGPIPGPCFEDADCDDGLYCNGRELCKTLSADSDVKVCMGPEQGPCGPSDCDEITKCDCTHPDQDHDGFNVLGCATSKLFDCDDTKATRSPGNAEVCDGEQLDEDCRDSTPGTTDADQDGFNDQSCANKLFYQPLFFTPQKPLITSGTDCDDGERSVHPGAVEVCDKLDNNCNGETDEVSGGQGDPHTYYPDKDGDYWGSDADAVDTLCNFPPPGYAIQGGDCDDNNPRVNIGREEICNGLDDDCNGKVDQPEKAGDLMFGQPYDGLTEFECAGVDGWKVKQCPSGRLNCNQSYLDACETIGTTLCNCHECGKTCAFSCGDADCEEIAVVSTGNLHTCGIIQSAGSTTGGTVACWGQNLHGQLGNGNTKDSARPIEVPDLANATAIASGEFHSCAIALGGRLFCWGDNEFGQLGSGAIELSSPDPVEIYQPSPTLKAKRVSSGSFHTCALFEDGRLTCWGRGEQGQLGNGDNANLRFPSRVKRIVDGVPQFVDDASQVVAGYVHSCSLSAGRVECWGDNSAQQLGVEPGQLGSSNVARPVAGALGGLQVEELSASSGHTCARAGADVYCWGSNYNHEIALSDVQTAPPTKIPLPIAAVSIATGYSFGCALADSGTVYCWGSNYSGERGTSDDPPSVLPTPVPLANVIAIFAGQGAHVCAVTRDAHVRCWGNNEAGELGNGESSIVAQPTPSPVLAQSGTQACVSP